MERHTTRSDDVEAYDREALVMEELERGIERKAEVRRKVTGLILSSGFKGYVTLKGEQER
jgi:hypothetical protein